MTELNEANVHNATMEEQIEFWKNEVLDIRKTVRDEIQKTSASYCIPFVCNQLQ